MTAQQPTPAPETPASPAKADAACPQLKRLHARGVITARQFEAGRLYYGHWHLSGLATFGAFDLSRVGESKGGAASVRLFRQGDEALEEFFRPYIHAIVLHGEDPEAVAKKIAGRKHTTAAEAGGLEYLRDGLDRLAGAYEVKQSPTDMLPA